MERVERVKRGNKDIQRLKENDPTLIILSFEYDRMGYDEAQVLAEALKVNTSLEELDFNHSKIGNKGARALADALKVNTTLKELDLSVNQIGNKGARALAEALKVNTGLKVLQLWSIEIDRKLLDEIEKLLAKEAILERQNQRKVSESLQQKCARLIRQERLDCSLIPKIIQERFYLPSQSSGSQDRSESSCFALTVKWMEIIFLKNARNSERYK